MKGTVKPRGDSWQVSYPYKDDEGQWRKKTVTARTEKEGFEKLNDLNLNFLTKRNMENPLLSEVREMWLDKVRNSGSPNTVRTYETTSRLVVEILDKPVQDIKVKDAEKFIAAIKARGFEARYYVNILSMMLTYAIKHKMITENVTRGLTFSRTKPKKKHPILDEAERQALIANFEGTRYYYPIIITLLNGLRIGELAGLQWKAIDFKKKTMKIFQQWNEGELTPDLKSEASYRTLSLDTATLTILKELHGSEFSTPTFVFVDHHFMCNQMSSVLSKYYPNLSDHSLRHNHGTDLLDITDPVNAAKRMGHSVEEYLKTYAHETDAKSREIAEKMEGIGSGLLGHILGHKDTGKVVELATRATSKAR